MLTRRWIPGLWACLLVAGCGDDAVFTKSEATALAKAVWNVSTAPGMEGVLATKSSSYDLEVECSRGGKTQTSGTMEGDGANHTVEGTTTITDCAEEMDRPRTPWTRRPDDVLITLNGDINRETELAFIRSDDGLDIDIEGRISGEFAWEDEGGESGTCELDLKASSEIDMIGNPVQSILSEERMSGRVCGTPVDVKWAPRFFGPPPVMWTARPESTHR